MPGGGCHGVAPGQVTDDSELAMCLMHGLIEGNGKLDVSKIVLYYGLWLKDGPFDRGSTVTNALKAINVDKPNPQDPKKAAMVKNSSSMSNGSLMKITPMAVWCQNLSDNHLRFAVEQDVELIHSNFDMNAVIISYCIAIKTLIANHEKADRA